MNDQHPNLIDGLMALYAAGLAGFLAARRRISDENLYAALANSGLHLLLVGAAGLLPLAVMRRRWRTALNLLPAVALFAREYGPLLLPRQVENPLPPEQQFTLLTYNLHAETGALPPLLEVILAADADIVAVQELAPETSAYLAGALRDSYPHQAIHTPADIPNAGQGIFSRFPITADAYWRNPHLPIKFPLGHQRAVIETRGGPVTLYNVHPVHPALADAPRPDARVRTQEIGITLEKAAQDTGPVVLCGDFNLTEQTDDYAMITARYADAFREAGRGFGWTFPDLTAPHTTPEYLAAWLRWLPLRPLARLDYVFHSAEVRGLAARVWPDSGGSDHRPVWVRLGIL